jgi:signal transduction histidine kinase
MALQPYESQVDLHYVIAPSVRDLMQAIDSISGPALILYVRYSSEQPGQVLFPTDVARRVGEAARVPVYTIHDAFLGSGIVGGTMHETRQTAARAAAIACQILEGRRAQDIPMEYPALLPIFDWRQVRRWGIDPASLPADSKILSREPTFWELYRWYIVGAVGVIVLQALLIVGLLAQRARRRRAEAEVTKSEAALRTSYERIRQLARQLISTREGERSRIARELHDNLSQQMALLSIDVDQLGREVEGLDPATARVRALAARAGEIASDIHDLSHELHPAKLEMLGLVPALHGLCRETSAAAGLDVALHHESATPHLSSDLALCLFRVAQEALHNVVRHSGATRADVRLSLECRTLTLSVADDGVGFDPASPQAGGIGLLSMRERVHLLGGDLDVRSAPGAGTTVTARLQLALAEPANS